MKATEAQLDALHAEVAEVLTESLKDAREAKDEAGKRKPVPASLILASMKFLKDNGIDTPASSPRLGGLARELLDIDLDEAGALRAN